MKFRRELTIVVVGEIDDDYPDPDEIINDVAEEMRNCERAATTRLSRIVPGAEIATDLKHQVWVMCPAMHCPEYRREHYMGADGCMYDEGGEERGV